MIFNMIFGVLLALFEELPALEVPSLLEQFGSVLEHFVSTFQSGLELCIMFMGVPAVRFLGIYLGIIWLLDSFYLAYTFVWWFITKIPMLNIKP